MAASDQMRRVLVDNVPINVPEYTTPSKIIQLSGQNPKERDLVKEYGDGTTDIFPSNRRIHTSDGDSFKAQLTAIEG